MGGALTKKARSDAPPSSDVPKTDDAPPSSTSKAGPLLVVVAANTQQPHFVVLSTTHELQVLQMLSDGSGGAVVIAGTVASVDDLSPGGEAGEGFRFRVMLADREATALMFDAHDAEEKAAWLAELRACEYAVSRFLPPYSGAHGEHELMAAMAKVAAMGERVGRWCAAQGKGWLSFRKEFLDEAKSYWMLRKNMADGVRAAPVDVQQHLVLTVVRLAQVCRGFEVGMHAEAAPPPAMAAVAWSAYYQLTILYGFKGEGPVKGAAEAECERLGGEMDEAWAQFPAEQRAKLMALPWENDPEPSEVGTWGTDPEEKLLHDSTRGHPILRPHLRQIVPAELGYVADSWEGSQRGTGDEQNDVGRRFVEEVLLPQSRRVLPLLEAAAQRVSQDLGVGTVCVGPLKTDLRMDEKAGNIHGVADADHKQHEFPKQASNVDVARLLFELPDPAALCEAHTRLKAQQKVVRVKNRFSPESPLYGYRDMLLNFDIDGVFCEMQLGLTPLVAVRKKMHRYYGLVRSTGFRSFVSMTKPAPAADIGPVLVAQMAAARVLYEALEASEKAAHQKHVERRLSNATAVPDWQCELCGGFNSDFKNICS
jgi:hypothetical protein